MKPESAHGSVSKRSCFCAPRFEGLVLQLYFFTLLLPSITNIVSDATYGLVCGFPIGLLACFALERKKSLISLTPHWTSAHRSQVDHLTHTVSDVLARATRHQQLSGWQALWTRAAAGC
jgi:hypothetical protein